MYRLTRYGYSARYMALTLTTDERTELERRVRSRTIQDARRPRVILMLGKGASYATSSNGFISNTLVAMAAE